MRAKSEPCKKFYCTAPGKADDDSQVYGVVSHLYDVVARRDQVSEQTQVSEFLHARQVVVTQVYEL